MQTTFETPGLPCALPAFMDPFLAEVLVGMRAAPKTLPCKYFYDERGSALFDAITTTSEYYPFRKECEILRKERRPIAEAVGPGATVVDLGGCNGAKARLLLDALEQPRGYAPVDVSAEPLRASARAMRADYPGLRVTPVTGDFTSLAELPDTLPREGRVVFFFAGSTIGNFPPEEAAALLRRLAALHDGETLFLVGVDLVKPRGILERAYNDERGLTAAFNLNLLARANRELGADFDLARFAHLAFYDEREGRIEMHLRSLGDQRVRIAGAIFTLYDGELIHTENSYKYDRDGFAALARGAGLAPLQCWTDTDGYFSLHLLTPRGRRMGHL